MRRRWPKTGNCAQRRHDLRGIAGDRCPECGLEILVTAVKIAARARTRRRSAVVGIALALAAGERTVDGSLSDPAAVKAVVNQPMKHRIAPIAPTGEPDPHVMQELNGRLAALLSIPRVFIDRAYIARELILNDGRASGAQTIEEEQLLGSLLSDPLVSSTVADAEVASALLGWAAKALVRRDGTATDWVLAVDFEITRVAIPGATEPPSTFTMQSRVPFGPGSRRQPLR